MHGGHQRKDEQQINGQQRDADVVGNEAEDRGHKAVAQVGAGHEHADNGLGVLRSETLRGGMDDAGIYGGAAQADEAQTQEGGGVAQGQQHRDYAQQYYAKARLGQPGVGKSQGEQAVESPAQGNAHKEQPGKGGGKLRGKAPVQHQIGARPQAHGLLGSAVAEKAEEHGLHSRDAGHLLQAQGLMAGRTLPGAAVFPQRQAQQQHGG